MWMLCGASRYCCSLPEINATDAWVQSNPIYLFLFIRHTLSVTSVPAQLILPTHSTFHPTTTTMSLFANIVGFSLFGLAARLGQLGIQKRNLFESTPRSFPSPPQAGVWFSSDSCSPGETPSSLFVCLFLLDLGGHAIAMGVFGFAGYWAHQWDQHAAVLIAEKRAQLAERRRARAEAIAATAAE